MFFFFYKLNMLNVESHLEHKRLLAYSSSEQFIITFQLANWTHGSQRMLRPHQIHQHSVVYHHTPETGIDTALGFCTQTPYSAHRGDLQEQTLIITFIKFQ